MSLPKIKNLYAVFWVLFCAANAFILVRDILGVQQEREDSRMFYFIGMRFSGLQGILKNVDYIGYYTDKDPADKITAAQFSQAQYILAPVILDLDNTSHRFILFNCSIEKKAFEIIEKIGAVPLKKNQYGIVLAERKRP